MDIGASNWSETDTNNNQPAPDGAPEGMFPSGVNDTIRAVMGALKRWFNWSIPKITAGSATAYTLTYGVAPGALVDGMTHLVQFHAGNGPGATLNVNNLGAKPLYAYSAGAWYQAPPALFDVATVCRVVYDAGSGAYRLLMPRPGLPARSCRSPARWRRPDICWLRTGGVADQLSRALRRDQHDLWREATARPRSMCRIFADESLPAKTTWAVRAPVASTAPMPRTTLGATGGEQTRRERALELPSSRSRGQRSAGIHTLCRTGARSEWGHWRQLLRSGRQRSR